MNGDKSVVIKEEKVPCHAFLNRHSRRPADHDGQHDRSEALFHCSTTSAWKIGRSTNQLTKHLRWLGDKMRQFRELTRVKMRIFMKKQQEGNRLLHNLPQ
jgi:hypothetical protein